MVTKKLCYIKRVKLLCFLCIMKVFQWQFLRLLVMDCLSFLLILVIFKLPYMMVRME